jgi:hypothetical protein
VLYRDQPGFDRDLALLLEDGVADIASLDLIPNLLLDNSRFTVIYYNLLYFIVIYCDLLYFSLISVLMSAQNICVCCDVVQT